MSKNLKLSERFSELSHNVKYENEEGHLPKPDLWEFVTEFIDCMTIMSLKIESIENKINDLEKRFEK